MNHFGSGAFTFLVDLVNETSSDYEIVIAYGRRKETLENFKDYFNKNVKFIEVKNFTRSINIKKDIKALLEIRKIVKIEKPDIVHLHSSKAGIIGRIGIHKKNIKLLYNPHGFSFLKLDDSKIKRLVYKMIEKVAAILNSKCMIVGCSKGEYEEARKLNQNSICINNGINTEKINEEIKGLEERKIDYNNLKICTVGRIGFQKNPKLFNEIAKKFPKLQFTWIGDGELRNELTAENIKVTGWLERKEVLKELKNNDIFLLLSLWEGLPLSLLEAMYMKKICIVSDVVGNRDVIKDGRNGYVYINISNFKKNIEYIKNPEKYEKITKNAYENIVQNYNVRKMTKYYEKIYKQKE